MEVGTLRRIVLNDGEVESFSSRGIDPSFGLLNDYSGLLRDLFVPLVRVDQEGNPQPGAARSWKTDAEGRTVDFMLFEDAVWSDGQPVVAGDFVYAWDRLADPAFAPGVHEGFKATVRAYEAVDDHVLRVTLHSPGLTEIGLFSSTFLVPLPGHAGPDERIHWSDWPRRVSSGAFVLEDFTPGGEVLLSANPEYPGTGPQLNGPKGTGYARVTYQVAEWGRASTLLLEGEADILEGVTTRQRGWLAERGWETVSQVPTLQFLIANGDTPATGDPDIRRAMSLVIDRERLSGIVSPEWSDPAYGLIPEGFAGFRRQDVNAFRPHDTDAAREIMLGLGFGAERRQQVTLFIGANDVDRQIGRFLRDVWSGIFIDIGLVELRDEDGGSFAKLVSGDYELVLGSWTPEYYSCVDWLNLCIITPRGICGHMEREPFQELMKQGVLSDDHERQLDFFARSEAELLGAETIVPLFFMYSRAVIAPTTWLAPGEAGHPLPSELFRPPGKG